MAAELKVFEAESYRTHFLANLVQHNPKLGQSHIFRIRYLA
jgi:hypothetical protein